MKTYILKRPVYNSVDFPIGTIIKPIKEEFHCFEVVEGDLKGEKGGIADGLDGWIINDTPENRKLCLEFELDMKKLKRAISKLYEEWDNLPTVKIN